MKIKIVMTFLVLTFVSSFASAQDTSQNQKLSNEHTYRIRSKKIQSQSSVNHPIYRDTRLGGSSPYFNTYQKNDRGAGGITTDPTKGNGTARYPGYSSDSSGNLSPVYRDTRLGGSSPNHKTYKTNNFGAGAITTDPNKGKPNGSSAPHVVNEAPDSTQK